MSAKKLLITESKLKSFTSINKNVDINLIKAEILITQDVYLEQILGTKFINSLYDKISVTGNTFTDDEKTLVDDFIAPYLIQMSYATLIPQLWARSVNRGIMEGNAESAQSVDVETMKYLKSIQLQKANHYEQRLIDYLNCEGGKDKFTDYINQNSTDGVTPQKTSGFNSPIVIDDKHKFKNVPTYSEDYYLYKNKR